jgi:hypothetical protein
MRAINDIPLGYLLLLPVGTVINVQTLKVLAVLSYDTRPGQRGAVEKNVALYGERVRSIYEARDAAGVQWWRPEAEAAGMNAGGTSKM